MLFPKLAIHISPFKLSHLANRGHLQFQNLRNTFNNINLGGTVAPNAPSVGSSASGGLGAATGPSTASGAGGAKWSAGSRAGWTQQTQGRLITQANSPTLDNQNSKSNDDDEVDDFIAHNLHNQSLYNKRNRTISSRWQHAQRNAASHVPTLALSSPGLQARYKSAFTGQCQQRTCTTITQRIDKRIESTRIDRPLDISSSQPARFDSSQQPRQISDAHSSPGRRHSVSGNSLDLNAIPFRSRRLSTSDAYDGAELRVSRSTYLDSRPYSSISGTHLSSDAAHMAPPNLDGVPTRVPLDQPIRSKIASSPVDERWLKQSIRTIAGYGARSTLFLRLRSLLDGYISSTTSPSTKVVDHMLWASVMTKPNYEPIHGLLGSYQNLLRDPKFKPSPDTYSIIMTALCQRDISNSREVELKNNKLREIMISQRLNQSLPNLSLAPYSSADDVRLIDDLTSEPNFDSAVHLFKTLSKANVRLLQPAALDALLQSCSNQSALDPENLSGRQSARLDLAIEVFGLLESQGGCTARSYASLMDVFGYSKDLPNAKEVYDDYRKVRTGLKALLSPLLHENNLKPPDLTGFSLAVDSSNVLPRIHREPRPADQVSDAMVLLSLMRAYLVNADPISAVTLLEESLANGTSDAEPIDALRPIGKITSDHILEIILGFVRLSDFRSASRWLNKLFKDEDTLYNLDHSQKRLSSLEKIVSLCCQPECVGGGLSVAYDAVKVNLEKMNPLLTTEDSLILMYRVRQVMSCHLVRALQHSASLQNVDQEAEAAVVVDIIKNSLERSTDLLCELVTQRSHILETHPEASAVLSNIAFVEMLENLLKRATYTCHHIRRIWIIGDTNQAKELTEFCQNMLIKLLSHYSSTQDHLLQIVPQDVEAQSEMTSLSALLTCYQNLIALPVVVDHVKSSEEILRSSHLQFALKVTSPVIINNMSLLLATQLFQQFSACRHLSEVLRSVNDWLVVLTAGAIMEVQVQEGTLPAVLKDKLGSSTQSILGSLLLEFERAVTTEMVKLSERDPAIDFQLLMQVVERYNIELPTEARLKAFFDELKSEGNVNSMETGKLRLERYRREGSLYVANRFSVLRDQEFSPNKTSESPQSTQIQSPPTTTFTPSSAPSSLPSPPFPASQLQDDLKSQSSPPPVSLPSVPLPDPSQALPPSALHPVVPAPHAPFQSFNERLSQIALSLFCSKDVAELDRMYHSVRESATRGNYLTPDASSALIETLGRLGQIERLREMYVYAHVGLASVDGATQEDQALRSTNWIRVEDRMIIGLAYCGALDELAIHKLRLLNNGAAPSADAYAAMIQHARETTDDASVALAYFEEAIQHRVPPNTFLCNTIISKLSKARRAPEALQVFEYMKQNNLPRNSVTFGAIINACCKTGDEKTAEMLFKEMLRSKYYKPRVPPFNTMIQLYTQGIKNPNREKVIEYFDEMVRQKIPPTDHTYNLLMQAYGLIEPYDSASMQDVFERACRDGNVRINGSHWATLINVKGTIEKDLPGLLKLFDSISTHPSTVGPRPSRFSYTPKLPDAVCYEALFNVLLGMSRTDLIPTYVAKMKSEGVHMTAYVVNTLIRAHASSGDIALARDLFESLVDPAPGQAAAFNHPIAAPITTGKSNVGDRIGVASAQKVAGRVGDPVYREPSSWETMIKAEVEHGDLQRAQDLVVRMETRAYPNALINRARKLLESSVNPVVN